MTRNLASYSDFFSHFFTKIFLGLGVFSFLVLTFCSFSSASADEGRLPSAYKTIIEKSEGLHSVQNLQGDSVEIISHIFEQKVVSIFKYIFIGVALIFMAMYAYSLSIGMGDEEQFTEQRKNFLFAIIGFFILGLASKIVEIVDPYKNNSFQTEIFDQENTENIIQTIITYLEYGLGILAIIVIFYGALMMIMSDGDDERSAMGKNILKYGFMGIAAVMLANVLVNNIFFTDTAINGGGIGDAETTEFIQQGAGILKFGLQFLAIGIFISFLIAGFLYLTARDDEEQETKAKNTLIWTAVGTLVVISSFGIISFFTPAG